MHQAVFWAALKTLMSLCLRCLQSHSYQLFGHLNSLTGWEMATWTGTATARNPFKCWTLKNLIALTQLWLGGGGVEGKWNTPVKRQTINLSLNNKQKKQGRAPKKNANLQAGAQLMITFATLRPWRRASLSFSGSQIWLMRVSRATDAERHDVNQNVLPTVIKGLGVASVYRKSVFL